MTGDPTWGAWQQDALHTPHARNEYRHSRLTKRMKRTELAVRLSVGFVALLSILGALLVLLAGLLAVAVGPSRSGGHRLVRRSSCCSGGCERATAGTTCQSRRSRVDTHRFDRDLLALSLFGFVFGCRGFVFRRLRCLLGC